MSHNIRYYDYKENCNKAKVEKELDHYVAMEDWQEGASGLPNRIRWIQSVLCDDYDSAEQYIQSHDKGWYDCLAVRYKNPIGQVKVESKKIFDLKERISKLSSKYAELSSKIHYNGVKSAFVSCSHCGSKIATSYIGKYGYVGNKCPVCKTDMRPKTVLDQIETVKKNLDNAKKNLQEEEKKVANRQKQDVRGLVKIEYHT